MQEAAREAAAEGGGPEQAASTEGEHQEEEGKSGRDGLAPGSATSPFKLGPGPGGARI